jgi:hypothetical protein
MKKIFNREKEIKEGTKKQENNIKNKQKGLKPE